MKQRTLKVVLLLVLLMSTLSIVSADAFLTPNGDNVDSGGHLDWESKTKYHSESVYAMNTWNGYKSGVVSEDNLFRIEDIHVSDYYDAFDSNIAYRNQPDAIIKYNKYHMDSMDEDQRKHTATHEFGHALGLGHNNGNPTAVMKQGKLYNTTLNQDDKDSYDEAEKLY